LPDAEWATSTAPSSFFASSDRRGTVGLGLGRVANQSGTICFQNSSIDCSGKRMPGKTFGYSGPKRKIAQAATCPAMKTGGVSAAGALPARTAVIADALAADRPRAT